MDRSNTRQPFQSPGLGREPLEQNIMNNWAGSGCPNVVGIDVCHNVVYQTSPKYLTDLLRFRTLGRGNIDPLCPIFARTEKVQMSFFPACTVSWNKMIKHDLRSIDDVTKFK